MSTRERWFLRLNRDGPTGTQRDRKLLGKRRAEHVIAAFPSGSLLGLMRLVRLSQKVKLFMLRGSEHSTTEDRIL